MGELPCIWMSLF